MRQPRLKAPEDWEFAYYHCVSRVVERRFALDEEAKHQFIKLMRLYEKVCQVRVVTYCLMSNHFHLLVEVPAKPMEMPGEAEIIEHISRCHGGRRAKMVEETIKQHRRIGAEELVARELEGWVARMWDLSAFMKTLKQRFTQWYNKRHERKGTLWEDRYRSTIVEGSVSALEMVACYIDLNPARAGIVDDPKDYLWSGYGAAVAGVKVAIGGLERVVRYAEKRPPQGRRALEMYRVALYGAGDAGDERVQAMAVGVKGVRRGIDRSEVEEVTGKEGRLSRWEMLRCRVRYFTAGAVIGSRDFVNGVFKAKRERFGEKRQEGARKMRGADFDGLYALRDLRTTVFG